MESASDFVLLLLDVLPVFEEATLCFADTSVHRSKKWIFYTEISSQFTTLSYQIEQIGAQLKRSGISESKCKPLLKDLLEYLEGAFHTAHEMNTINYAFPNLEHIRSNQHMPPGGGTDIFYEVSDPDSVYDRFDLWTRKLERLTKYEDEGVVEETHRLPKLCSVARESAKQLKTAIDRVCNDSCTAHSCMLFLSTYRNAKNIQSHLGLETLLSVADEEIVQWREGKVYVMSGDNRDQESPRETTNEGIDQPPRRGKVISALCESIRKTHPIVCLNLRLEDDKLYRTHPTPSRLRPLKASPDETLLGIITGTPIISVQSKIMLAVVIAYSVLYLSGTSWLPPGWDKTSIYVLKPAEESAFILRPMLATNVGKKKDSHRYIPSQIHEQPDLLQLGVTLIEIFLKAPIENFRDEEEDIGSFEQIEADTNYFTANRVLSENDWDVHESYEAAVTACLDCDIASSDQPEHQSELCSYIYNDIIKPLEAELTVLCGIQPDDLDEQLRKFCDKRSWSLGNTSAPASKVTDAFGQRYIQENKSRTERENTEPLPHAEETSYSMPVAANLNQVKDDSHLLFPLKGVSTRTETVYAPSFVRQATNEGMLRYRKPLQPAAQSFSLFDDHELLPSRKAELSRSADEWFRLFNDAVYNPQYAETSTNRNNAAWGYRQESIPRVKIALIDSGIDPNDAIIARNRSSITYRDFVAQDHATPQDPVGHGNHNASVLLGIARHADVLVARIVEGRRQPRSPSVIADALNYAVDDWNADIICMPFGFPELNEELQCIQSAIEHAASKRVIMFAAAANHGGLRDVAYPANQEQVICVSSTDGKGNASDFNPSPEGYNTISVLGEAVPSVWPQRGASRRKTGTSFATPIAAGIAAILMDYLRRRQEPWTVDQRFSASKIRSRKGMLAAMKGQMSTERDRFVFIRPWELFQKSPDIIDTLLLETLRRV